MPDHRVHHVVHRTATTFVAATIALILCFTISLGLAASAHASTAGILPGANPSKDCRSAGASVMFTLTDVNYCRSLEGVGAMQLPSNWNSLSTPQRLFVIANLERVNRGEAPIVALTSGLDSLAQAGAAAQTDPNFPSGPVAGGSVWAGGGGVGVVAADDMWMYYDGLGGTDYNMDCSASSRKYCWGHRDIILERLNGPLYAGAGYVNESGSGSFALEILSGVKNPHPVFTWASELRYFNTSPHVERTAIRRR